jgi:outer membrane protein assembly factor BamB
MRGLDAEGWPLWSARVGDARLSRPARRGELIYVSDAAGQLAAIRGGRVRFKLRLDRAPITAPAVSGTLGRPVAAPHTPPDLVLVGTPSGRTWAVTPEGKVRWFHSGSAAVSAPPAPLADGAVVTSGRELTCLDRDGQVAWSAALGAGCVAGPVRLGGAAVVVDGLGSVQAHGERRPWQQRVAGRVAQLAPLAAGDGVLLGTADGRLIEIGATGELMLDVPLPGPVAAVAAGPRAALVVLEDGAVLSVDLATGIASRILELPAPVADAAVGEDGAAAIASTDGVVTLLGPGWAR